MKPVKAICYPGTTFSPSLIRHSVLYFDKILILDPVVDSTKIKEEVDEINDTLNSIDKTFFLDIAKDNVPFWMTLGTSSDPKIVLSGMAVSFILSGISSYRYLTDRNYSKLESRLQELESQIGGQSEIEILANSGIVDSISNSFQLRLSSASVDAIFEKTDLNQFDLSSAINEFYSQSAASKQGPISPIDSILLLKKHISLLIEAYNRQAYIVTDNPSVQKILDIIAFSILADSDSYSSDLNQYLADTHIKGSLGVKSIFSTFPNVNDCNFEEIIDIRQSNEASLRRLRHYIASLSEKYYGEANIEHMYESSKIIAEEIAHELDRLQWQYRKDALKFVSSSIANVVSLNPLSLISSSLELYGNLKERRQHSLEFLRRIKLLGRKKNKK